MFANHDADGNLPDVTLLRGTLASEPDPGPVIVPEPEPPAVPEPGPAIVPEPTPVPSPTRPPIPDVPEPWPVPAEPSDGLSRG